MLLYNETFKCFVAHLDIWYNLKYKMHNVHSAKCINDYTWLPAALKYKCFHDLTINNNLWHKTHNIQVNINGQSFTGSANENACFALNAPYAHEQNL